MIESEVLEKLQEIENKREQLILYVLDNLKTEYEKLKQPRTCSFNINMSYEGVLPMSIDLIGQAPSKCNLGGVNLFL